MKTSLNNRLITSSSSESLCEVVGTLDTGSDGRKIIHLAVDGAYTGALSVYDRIQLFRRSIQLQVGEKQVRVDRKEYRAHLAQYEASLSANKTYQEIMSRVSPDKLPLRSERLWRHLSVEKQLRLFHQFVEALRDKDYAHAESLVRYGVPMRPAYIWGGVGEDKAVEVQERCGEVVRCNRNGAPVMELSKKALHRRFELLTENSEDGKGHYLYAELSPISLLFQLSREEDETDEWCSLLGVLKSYGSSNRRRLHLVRAVSRDLYDDGSLINRFTNRVWSGNF